MAAQNTQTAQTNPPHTGDYVPRSRTSERDASVPSSCSAKRCFAAQHECLRPALRSSASLRSTSASVPSAETSNPPRAITEETGATMLEWALLLAAIGIPSYWVIRTAMDALTGYYAMMTTLNGLPLP